MEKYTKHITIVFNHKGKQILKEDDFDRLPVSKAYIKDGFLITECLEEKDKEGYHLSMIDYWAIYDLKEAD